MEEKGIMRDLVRQIVEAYKSPELEGQDEGYVLFRGQEPGNQLPVWIRILPRLLGEDPQIATRFRELAQAIRQLNHPNIAAVRDVGEKAGLPYVVTRAIEKAHPLAAKLDQPWAVDAAADLTMQVGQAMEHAYKKGIVHGSLSPEKVMVEDDGRVRVTDFGLHELLDLVGVQAKQAASPYQAPERTAGEKPSAPADVYALAAILYGLLAKKPPQVVRGQVLPPSRFNPDVPEAMDKVVVQALAPDPAERFSDVRSFLAALGSVTLAPMVKKAQPARVRVHCPQCGAGDQSGRFCRKCGARLKRLTEVRRPAPAESKLDEPIQITKIDVGRIDVGAGVEVKQTTIAQPITMATTELADLFPEPLPMPEVDLEGAWPGGGDQVLMAMPEPPAMPVIDWAEIAPPMPEVPAIGDIPVEEETD
jgi:serine/threonine protein kinase